MTYQDWVNDIQWLRTKIILPNGSRIERTTFMTDGEVDANKLNEILLNGYKQK